jgi:hypothetical protein
MAARTDSRTRSPRPRRGRHGLIRIGASALVLVLAGLAVAQGTLSAFSGSTANPGNTLAAGTVVLTDNDSGTASFSLAGMTPGTTDTGCIQVTSNGSLPSIVRLYGTTTGTGLAAYLDLTVTRGTVSSGSFDSCTNFSADTADHVGLGAGVIYQGTLAAFGDDWSGGVVDAVPAVPAVWATGETHAYKFQVTLQDADAAQGLTAGQTFTWEARDATYAQTVLSDTPVSYWRMEETSGTAAADAKGVNAGTYTGGPTLGQDGLIHDGTRAPRFVSGSNKVTVASSASLSPTSAITVEAWVRVEDVPPNYRRMAWKGTSAYQLRLDGTNETSRFSFFVSIGGALEPRASGGSVPTVGSVHHLVGTYDGAKVRLYVDGALVGQQNRTGAIDTNSSPFEIASTWNGLVDEVAVYDYALGATRVAAHYAAAPH